MLTLPRVEVGRLVWRRIVRELDRVAPAEGLAVPLLALTPREPGHNPCAVLALEDLAVVTIARAALVPAELQRNGLLSVRALLTADDEVNREVVELCLRYPRLRPAGHLHSHPFAVGHTWPSGGGGDVEGHMLPLLARNQEAGLDASFSFIACRDPGGCGWRLSGFAMDGAQHIHALGPCQIVDDGLLIQRGLFTPGLDRQPLLRGLWHAWTRELRARGYTCRSDTLLDGWQRSIVDVKPELRAVFLLPVDFPERACQVHLVWQDAPGSKRFFSPHLSDVDSVAWLRVLDEVEEACRVAA